MTAPEPRANPLLLGHEPAEALLLDAMRSQRMHHAWLITGPDGVGKATLAFRFARRLLAGMSEEDPHSLEVAAGHPVFRRVAARSHADLLTIELAYDAKRKRIETDLKTQRAAAKIEYVGKFVDPAASTARAAPAPAPVAPPAADGMSAEDISKGMGIKK